MLLPVYSVLQIKHYICSKYFCDMCAKLLFFFLKRLCRVTVGGMSLLNDRMNVILFL